MSWLRIKTLGARTTFQPGEVLAGTADWDLEPPTKPGHAVELRLLWVCQGLHPAPPYLYLVDSIRFEAPALVGSQDFGLQIPEGPYSFEGRLLAIRWALEAVVGGTVLGRLDLVVSPTEEPVRVQASSR